ncbi:MAG: DUF523 domain-containing protein [Vicinamibacteria bacterium]
MVRVLVSACLLGERVRYDGRDAAAEGDVLARWNAEGRVVRFCPEVAGGLPVPRPPAEIRGASVVTADGTDMTGAFAAGAQRALEAALANGVRVAVLKENSPSCGSTHVYDGTFSGTRVPGQGVTAALFAANGIRVFSERTLAEADAYLAAMETR